MILNLVMIFAIILVGAMLMRMKGGGIITPEADGKLCSSICFGVMTFYLTGDPLCGFLAIWAYFLGNSLAIEPQLTQLGGYYGPLNNTDDDSSNLIVRFLDFVMEHLHIKITPRAIHIVHGWVGTAIRGAFMGLLLAIVFRSAWMILPGLAMAPAYYAGMTAWQYARRRWPKTYRKYVEGWSLGEWFYGGVINLAVALWVIFVYQGEFVWMKIWE